MTNQNKRARKWAEYIIGNRPYADDGALAAAKFVIANTKPETMESQVWDPEKHALTGADMGAREVIMLDVNPQGSIFVMDAVDHSACTVTPHLLTPNGKKYKVVEDGVTVSQHENVGDDQTGRPKVLETEMEYGGAPVGTAVFRPITPRIVYCKTGHGIWEETGGKGRFASYEMCGVVRVVLRWGDES